MSRLLYILICIDLCFCYNFIDNYKKYVKKHIGSGKASRERSREARVVFDVADFMKTERSSDIGLEDLYNDYGETGHIQSNHDYNGLINDINKNSDENDYFNVKDSDMDNNLKDLLSLENSINGNDPEFDDDVVKTGYQGKKLHERSPSHSLEKKCAFKKMKVPFFSPSPSTTKPGKTKKNKFICINCHKNDKNEPVKYTRSNLGKPKRLSAFKHHKDLFKNFLGHKKPKEKVIHNCRQFYQNKAGVTESSSNPSEGTKTTEQLSTEKVKANVDIDSEIMEDNDSSQNGHRAKREEMDERERRLKILDELEKKVDNTRIASPMLTKATHMLTNAKSSTVVIHN